MKKIGIITYHNTTNYGALLQAFALQSKLKELGADAEIVNYHCKNIEDRELVNFPSFNSDIIDYLRNIRRYYIASKKRKLMNQFINKNVSISKEEYSKNTISKSNKIYDKFIVGSDMVFETSINGGDMTFYLDFAENKKRYSYAASLGVEKIDDKYLNKCINELEKFQYISIREEEGKKYFSKILKNKVNQDIDPTLLYDASFWQKYEESPKERPKKGYILLYFVSETMPEFDIALKIAKERDLEVYVLINGVIKRKDCKTISDASVGEFLYYIHNAALVITGSFHGMVFSMNYNTNFMYFCKSNSSSRLDNLAKITKLDNRKLKPNKIPEGNCDFSSSNVKLQELREESINHLRNILEG